MPFDHILEVSESLPGRPQGAGRMAQHDDEEALNHPRQIALNVWHTTHAWMLPTALAARQRCAH